MAVSNSLLNLAHEIVQSRLKTGTIAIDATMGNGHDTLWLAQLVAPFGMVYSFDIQIGALMATRNRLQEANCLDNVQLILDSHANLKQHIDQEHAAYISAVMFNLGYLPGSDKTIQTQIGSTLAGLKAALEVLASNGIITVLAYPGHQGGNNETQAVQNWCDQLQPLNFKTTLHLSEVASNSAPRLFVIEKNLP